MKCIEVIVESNGCPSCIATIIPYFLRVPGVRGVKVYNKRIYVLINDHVSPEIVVSNQDVNLYYKIHDWRVVNPDECLGRKTSYKLS